MQRIRWITINAPMWKAAKEEAERRAKEKREQTLEEKPQDWRKVAEPRLAEYRTREERLRPLRNEDWLGTRYWVEERSLKEIADELGCTPLTVLNAMKRFGIPRRGPGPRKKKKDAAEPDPKLAERARHL